ncbi:hypothetical protein HanHA300_Chr04g0150161 [Helianthus annuus]|nr:hypothetical protein HanHA300_Chr04g0150161 [Helianthus annuus]KAJ0598229.1 hypothetical protein HanHA89_Chr04g0163471 [Helianthus annuus]KAJ0758863.1 hypothetical protein HanLR1_Chr04g0155081 [Helianthus annuus]
MNDPKWPNDNLEAEYRIFLSCRFSLPTGWKYKREYASSVLFYVMVYQ